MKFRSLTNYRDHYTPLTNFTVRSDLKGIARRLTTPRFRNISAALYAWKRRRSILKSLPLVIHVESSSVCNLRCRNCPIGNGPGSSRNAPRMLTKELLTSIVTPLSRHALMIKFHIIGEPLTNPAIFDLVALATDHGLYSSLSTNGTLITSESVDAMLSSGLNWISVCLDGLKQETYSRFRIGGDVHRVQQAIAMITDAKRKRRLDRPWLNVFVTTFRDVQPEIPEIEQFCREHRVDQLFLRADQWNVDGSHLNVIIPKPRRKCVAPWIWGLIDVDGSVYPCCHSFYRGQRIPYGNVRETDFTEIWNNSLFCETREYLSGKAPQKPHLNLPCYNCDAFC